MAESEIEAIRNELARARDRLEAVNVPDPVAKFIVDAAAGALTTALVALDHPEVRTR